MLIEIIERLSPETGRKSTVYRLACDSCAKVIEASRCRYVRGPTHFCDNRCRGKYRHDHPELWKKAVESMNSAESHAKAKATIREKASRGEWSHWLGKKHSEETKRHLSEIASDGRRAGEKNGMHGRNHSESSKEKMSESKTKLILEGKFRPGRTGHKKGHYKDKLGRIFFFRSSWEEAMMQHLDVDDSVLEWEYENLRIPYFYVKEGKKRWYVPDFLVKRKDGTKQLLEIKPSELSSAEKVILKSEAAKRWCSENGAQFIIVTRKVLDEWNIVVG